tara:strand:- start:2977 stop:3456 length:480 start_codon:yes stop_codon:yes gene_type:complete
MHKHVKNLHKTLKKHYCDAGNCRDIDDSKKRLYRNNRNQNIINNHSSRKIKTGTVSGFYTSGIYGTQNCNTFITKPGKSQTDIALESVDNVLSSGGEPTIPVEKHTNSAYCKFNIEGFSNTSDETIIKSKRLIYRILLIIIIICLIGWIYYSLLYLNQK